MLLRSLGKAWAGDGHAVGQFVSAMTIPFPHVLAMLVRLVLRLESVAAELLGEMSALLRGKK